MIKRFELWKLSLLNVFSVPVRSLLTVLGFAIGVAAVLAVVTLGEAGRVQVENEMARLGINQIWLKASGDGKLDIGLGKMLEKQLGVKTAEVICLPSSFNTPNGECISAVVVGCSEGFLDGAVLSAGRLPKRAEWRQEARIAVAGAQFAEKMGFHTGDIVTFMHRSYLICAVVSGSKGVSSADLEEALLLPVDAVSMYTQNQVHEIQLALQENHTLQNVQQKALLLLESNGYQVRATTMEVQMEAAESVIDTFVNVLKWVAVICILVGGIGIMNILMVSVSERKREIGVMKSMGTTQLQICMLFLLEALIYAVVGGFLGILLGMGLIDAAGRSIELNARADAAACIGIFICALCAGVLFGVTPAMKAARLTCVDALRQE